MTSSTVSCTMYVLDGKQEMVMETLVLVAVGLMMVPFVYCMGKFAETCGVKIEAKEEN